MSKNEFDFDEEFENDDYSEDNNSSNSGNDSNSFLKLGIIIVIALIVIFLIYFLFAGRGSSTNTQTSNKEDIVVQQKITFELNGDSEITINLNETYEELGFVAKSETVGDLNSYVKVSGEVDTTVPGTYEITYSLVYDSNFRELTRIVKVVDPNNPTVEEDKEEEKPVKDSASDDANSQITITLNGSQTVYLLKGSTYVERGAKAVNKNSVDVSSKIVISSSTGVNTNQVGTYTINYSVTTSKNTKVTASRTVRVLDITTSITQSVKHYTNKDVDVRISVSSGEMGYIVLPNGSKVSGSYATYAVSANGVYEFQVYNKYGLGKRYKYTVANIDKQAPTGSCSISKGANGSIVTVNANDNIGIKSYYYGGKHYASNTLKFSGHFASGKSVSVVVYDKASNSVTVTCTAP